MYELEHIRGDTYCIRSPTNIGVVKTGEDKVCIIDSGNDKDAGRKVRQVLDANGWKLGAIYNTHSHADHIGGNRYLQDQYGCDVFANGIECDLVNHTRMEPIMLYGGSPMKDLCHKMTMAKESRARPIEEGRDLETIPLPGHSMDMVGFRTGDDVVFLGDCLASRQTIDKYGVVFIHDIADYLATLEKVKGLEAEMFIPAHCEPTKDIAPLAEYNIEKTLEVADRIIGMCSEPSSFEDILAKVFDGYSLRMSLEQYYFVGSTVRSYLAWMKDEGRMDCSFEDNRMLWNSVRS